MGVNSDVVVVLEVVVVVVKSVEEKVRSTRHVYGLDDLAKRDHRNHTFCC